MVQAIPSPVVNIQRHMICPLLVGTQGVFQVTAVLSCIFLSQFTLVVKENDL